MRFPIVPALILTMVALLTGCGDGRPPVQGDQFSDVPVGGIGTTTSTLGDTCSAGDVRQCRLVFIDEDGNKNCPEALQFCRSDGTGWLPCSAPPDDTSP